MQLFLSYQLQVHLYKVEPQNVRNFSCPVRIRWIKLSNLASFIYIAGYLNVRKMPEMLVFRTFVGALPKHDSDEWIKCTNKIFLILYRLIDESYDPYVVENKPQLLHVLDQLSATDKDHLVMTATEIEDKCVELFKGFPGKDLITYFTICAQFHLLFQ